MRGRVGSSAQSMWLPRRQPAFPEPGGASRHAGCVLSVAQLAGHACIGPLALLQPLAHPRWVNLGPGRFPPAPRLFVAPPVDPGPWKPDGDNTGLPTTITMVTGFGTLTPAWAISHLFLATTGKIDSITIPSCHTTEVRVGRSNTRPHHVLTCVPP